MTVHTTNDEADVDAASITPSTTMTTPKFSLPDLPEDCFLPILEALAIFDVARCAMLSRSWRAAFTNPLYLRMVLKNHASAREMQDLIGREHDTALLSRTFNRLASRYYHLTHGKIRTIDRYKLAASEQRGDFCPVGQWDFHESQPGGRLYFENASHQLSRLNMPSKPYLFRSTLWSYAEPGLLVYAPEQLPPDAPRTHILALLDLSTGFHFSIPFDIAGKVVRNIRLADMTLIIEWAERDPFHSLNDMEQVNRHFASCFDVVPSPSTPSGTTTKSPTLTHTATHYAIYFWQPNRSMYTGDEELPIESLFVWDISSASTYRPSLDPSGANRPQTRSSSPTHGRTGPHILARFPFNELELLGVRQHSRVRLMNLSLDSSAKTLTWRENTCEAGQGYFDPAARFWRSRTTTFLFQGSGPHLVAEGTDNLPPYRGHGSMESAPLEDEEAEKWFVPVMDVLDQKTGVRISLVETCFTGWMVENRLVLRIGTPQMKAAGSSGDDHDGFTILRDDAATREVSAMGRIAGDERWVLGQNGGMEIAVLRF
ncbi:uncharacterized protein AB675_97 [Cyphellophora attinorum]|uniref:F-box domain-containing protein n=1 Tax=Cyphellophora attinorum TaxID=1664694 RepID=A0A0N0NK55_9EURO|nr:uncharacterized protein AB675_97 [Phialophora attinorum]KPI37751.1 hypothetical protein AB675_97 [Phialophora attinorum]